jgi:aspartate/methionine/tyrosine aminotransferase
VRIVSDPLAMSGTAAAIRASLFADLAPRIEARLRNGGDLVALHIGDTYVEPPASARFSHVDETAFDSAVYRYGPIGGLASLKEAFVARLRLRDVGPHVVEPGRNVLVACGATHAIFCGARAVLDPGDEVLVAAPYWPLAVGIIRAVGAVPVEVPLTAHLYADPSVDVAAILDERATARTRAIYLITPNNPDGKVLSPRQLGAIAHFAIARGLWVIADEVYADYVYDGRHTSIARLEGMEERTLSAYSLSKSDALAGARIGFLVASERVVDLATRVATHTVFKCAGRVSARCASSTHRPRVVDRRRATRLPRCARRDDPRIRRVRCADARPRGGKLRFRRFCAGAWPTSPPRSARARDRSGRPGSTGRWVW